MNSKLLETLADIAYTAGEMNYFSGDSRADISDFILWAKEFQTLNSKTDWDEIDYRLSIEDFATMKFRESIRV